jgi:murein DD-endopeptidase MepM/ murein hydrolase activator NlpD
MAHAAMSARSRARRLLPTLLPALCAALFAALYSSVACGAAAGLTVRAPDAAPQGSAALVEIVADRPVEEITVTWLKRRVTVPAASMPDGRTARLFVPVPLEGTNPLPLAATAKNGDVSLAAAATIRPLKVAWPRQELAVEPRYVDPPAATAQRIQEEQRRNKAALDVIRPQRWWRTPFVRPVPGEPSGAFGEERVFNGKPRSRHRGLDLRGAQGTPVQAMADGRVVIAGEQYFSGKVVFIDHGLGLVSMYAHMSAIHVEEGAGVKAGQRIGLVGATGRVTGPHLHFGVYVFGLPVDPLSVLAAEAR